MSKDKKEEQFKNPADYGYKGDEEVVITGFQFREMIANTQQMLVEEMREYFPEHTKMVNKDYQEASEEEIAANEAFEVMDLERILQDQEPKIFYTRAGRRLLRLRFMLEQIHAENVEKGISPSIEELKKQAVESQIPKMTKVE